MGKWYVSWAALLIFGLAIIAVAFFTSSCGPEFQDERAAAIKECSRRIDAIETRLAH